MAFDPAEVESEAPDAWTGKSTALVYELASVVEAWLTKRGHAAFAALEVADKDAVLLRMTELAEDIIKPKFRGRPVRQGQRLLFPARGAYDGRGALLDDNEAPAGYLEGIRLMCELEAGGNFMPTPGELAGIAEERNRRGGIVYRQNIDPAALSTQHPDVWRKLRQAVPRLL
jgi:hypothetical protein